MLVAQNNPSHSPFFSSDSAGWSAHSNEFSDEKQSFTNDNTKVISQT